ncbi:winged helix-turn-helix transcriptional regulator [Tunturiibacter gelidoferens]|uniref:winged helix-turn-helix transcriptional regulator n=1 Tax=Tunturiibacter gelidiferens TaxID=3069689 RepID=UPI003873C3AE
MACASRKPPGIELHHGFKHNPVGSGPAPSAHTETDKSTIEIGKMSVGANRRTISWRFSLIADRKDHPLLTTLLYAFDEIGIHEKWRIQILCVMREGPVRLGQLGWLIPSASKEVLTESLRNLESAGLVVRTDMSRQVRHVGYDLAESSKLATYELLDSLAKWGEVYNVPRRRHPWRPVIS